MADRPIEVLINLASYDNLTHNEVITLINYKETCAYEHAYNVAINSAIVADGHQTNEYLKAKTRELINIMANNMSTISEEGQNEA